MCFAQNDNHKIIMYIPDYDFISTVLNSVYEQLTMYTVGRILLCSYNELYIVKPSLFLQILLVLIVVIFLVFTPCK